VINHEQSTNIVNLWNRIGKNQIMQPRKVINMNTMR
jgi:hypothetical protein